MDTLAYNYGYISLYNTIEAFCQMIERFKRKEARIAVKRKAKPVNKMEAKHPDMVAAKRQQQRFYYHQTVKHHRYYCDCCDTDVVLSNSYLHKQTEKHRNNLSKCIF